MKDDATMQCADGPDEEDFEDEVERRASERRRVMRFARALGQVVLDEQGWTRPDEEGRSRPPRPWERVLSFLGVEDEDEVEDDVVGVPGLLRDLHLHAFDRIRPTLEERWEVRLFGWQGPIGGKVAPRHAEIQVGHEETRRVLVHGLLLCEGEAERAAIALEEGRRGGLSVRILTRRDEAGAGTREELRRILDEEVERAVLYRGERLVVGSGGIRFLPPSGVGREDLVLPEGVWRSLERNVLRLVEDVDRWRAAGLEARRSMLLSGRPGVGKTQVGRFLADAVPATFIWVTAEGLLGTRDVSVLFELARRLTPTVLFLEDLDVACRGRRSMTFGELLAQLDGLHDNDGLVCLATSNDPEALDEALADRPGRFDLHVRLEPPAPEQRRRLLARFLEGADLTDRHALLDTVAERTDGLTGAHLREVATAARVEALEAAGWPDEPPAIDREAFEQALAALDRSRPEVGFPRGNGG